MIAKLATSTMPVDALLPFTFAAIKLKKVIAAFDGGRLSSDGGVTLFTLAEKRVGFIERLSKLVPDERDQERVTQLVISCLENGSDLRDTIRLAYALIGQWTARCKTPPDAVPLDIDDTCATVLVV